MLEKNPTDGARLIDAAIKLDHEAEFPLREVQDLGKRFEDRNPFAMHLLRQMVAAHLNMFDLGYRTNQRACDALGIAYRSSRFADPRLRKLTS